MRVPAADSHEEAAFSSGWGSGRVTLKQLKYLVGIADSGLNITSAAERLFTSQPGISKQLKQLEAELGVQLFTRKGKSLAAITPAGREVIARARKILREVGNITSLASDLTAELDGTLSIATTHTQARYVLPEVIRAFRERYPRVDLELHQGTSEQIAELISTNKVDFAIATGSQDLFSHLTLMPIYHWHRIVLVPKGHALTKHTKPLDLKALADHPLVTYVFSGTGVVVQARLPRARPRAARRVHCARRGHHQDLRSYGDGRRRHRLDGVRVRGPRGPRRDRRERAISARHDLARLPARHGAARLHGRLRALVRAALLAAADPRRRARAIPRRSRRAAALDRVAAQRRLRAGAAAQRADSSFGLSDRTPYAPPQAEVRDAPPLAARLISWMPHSRFKAAEARL